MQTMVIIITVVCVVIYFGIIVLYEVWEWIVSIKNNIQNSLEEKRQKKIQILRDREFEIESIKLAELQAKEANEIAEQRKYGLARIIGQPDFNKINMQIHNIEAATKLYESLNAHIKINNEKPEHTNRYIPVTRARSASQEIFRALSHSSNQSKGSQNAQTITLRLDDLNVPLGETIVNAFTWRLGSICYPQKEPKLHIDQPNIPSMPANITIQCNDLRLIIDQNGKYIEPTSDFLKKAYYDEIQQLNLLQSRCINLKKQAQACYEACEIAHDLAKIRLTNQKLEAKQKFEELLSNYLNDKNKFEADWRKDLQGIQEAISSNDPKLITAKFSQALSLQALPIPPDFVWEVFYEPETKTVQVNQQVPALDKIIVKRNDSNRAISKRDTEEFKRKIMPLIALHTAQQVAKNDENDFVKDIVVNLIAEYNNNKTGKSEEACILTFRVNKDTILSIQINNTDPPVALRSLGGIFVYDPKEIVPVDPIFDLNREDARFVEGKDILSDLVQGQNLAAMDWQDFEHLIRELFSKEFSKDGAEVKITRASRDRGVDAVAFDPDPIRGGKFVIQAKRYTGTVDVSAVRDLYGTLVNEGASKGILVTTSKFGPDAREFIANKPLTLIDGGGLLSMLERHGYRFKIDLEEAKKLMT